MSKETFCWVVDETGKVIVSGGEFIELVSKDHKSLQNTHVIVGYHVGDDRWTGENKIVKIFPLSRVFFKDIDMR